MERKISVKCQKCGQIMDESKHKHFPTETSNVFKSKCINKDCSEFGKVHVVMESKLRNE